MAKAFLIAVKVILAFGLVYYLATQGWLDFSSFRLFYQQPLFVLSLWLSLVGCNAFLTSWRLLHILPPDSLRFKQALKYTWIGNFFNSTLPGAVSGDLVKGLYLYQALKPVSKKDIAWWLFLDRACGLFALVLLSACAFFIFRITSSAKTLVGFGWLGWVYFVFFALGILILSRQYWGKYILERFIFSQWLALYGEGIISRPSNFQLAKAYSISLVIIFWQIVMVYFSSYLFIDTPPGFFIQASIIPIGLILTVLPIAPAGIGVGHTAFAYLYSLFGVSEGANIFNLFLLAQVVASVLGVVPFLGGKKSAIT